MKIFFKRYINCILLLSSFLICNVAVSADSTDPTIVPNLRPNTVFVLATGVLDPPTTSENTGNNSNSSPTRTYTVNKACPLDFKPYMTMHLYKVVDGNLQNNYDPDHKDNANSNSTFEYVTSGVINSYASCVQKAQTVNNTTQITYLVSRFKTLLQNPWFQNLVSWNNSKTSNECSGDCNGNTLKLYGNTGNDQFTSNNSRVGAVNTTPFTNSTDYISTHFGLSWVLYCYPPNQDPPSTTPTCDPNQDPYKNHQQGPSKWEIED